MYQTITKFRHLSVGDSVSIVTAMDRHAKWTKIEGIITAIHDDFARLELTEVVVSSYEMSELLNREFFDNLIVQISIIYNIYKIEPE